MKVLVCIKSVPAVAGRIAGELALLEPHDRLTVIAVSEVWTSHARSGDRRAPTPLELHDYLHPTGYAPFTDRIRAFVGGRSDARELMSAVHAALVYERGATDVQTQADEVLALGRGVCQDFAHVLLAACRCAGIPARYVSGYLYDPTVDGDDQASHAWVDVWGEPGCWLSLDPTHDREETEAYVRVAVGRDYADVPPTRGVYKGTARETLSVRVGIQGQ